MLGYTCVALIHQHIHLPCPPAAFAVQNIEIQQNKYSYYYYFHHDHYLCYHPGWCKKSILRGTCCSLSVGGVGGPCSVCEAPLSSQGGPWFCSAVTLWTLQWAPSAIGQVFRGLKGEREALKGCHHTWLRDWMALDSAAARARLCHMVAGVWEAGCRESFSARDSIMAYA